MLRWWCLGAAFLIGAGMGGSESVLAGNGHVLFGVDAGPASMSADPSIPILPTTIEWESNPDTLFPPFFLHKRECDAGYAIELFTETATNGPLNEVLGWGAGVRADGFIPVYTVPWVDLELKQAEGENQFLEAGVMGSVVLSMLGGRNERNLLHKAGNSYHVKRGTMLRTGIGLGVRYVKQTDCDGEWDFGTGFTTGLGLGVFNVQRGFLHPSDTNVALNHDPREEALVVFLESKIWLGRVWPNGVGAYLSGSLTRLRTDGIFGEYQSSTTAAIGFNLTVPPQLLLEALGELVD